MARLGVSRPSKWKVTVAAITVAALTLLAVATTASAAQLKDLGHGVTKDKIKLGIAVIDYSSIAEHVDFERGNQVETAKIFVDDINKKGGINGRQIEAFIKEYPPLPGSQPDPLSLCTAWTEDDGVFAVLGVFIDFSGQGQLCITKEHNTVHIGHELEQKWIDQAPPGLMLTPDTTKESVAVALINDLVQTGKLKGKKVAILADKESEDRAKNVIQPTLADSKVKTGSTAVLAITTEDTSAAQAQLDSFIEKWKTEKVNAIFIAGLRVGAKQFVEKIKQALPNALLITDSDSNALQAQDEVKAGKKPNPYEGMLSSSGPTASERWANKNATLQNCVDVYEKATGKTVPGPDNTELSSSGKKIQLYTAVTDFCGELQMFKTIAEEVGPNLTIKNWQKTVNKLGSIDLASTDNASLCKGKYAADDSGGLVAFDSSVGQYGDFKAAAAKKELAGLCTTKGGAGAAS